MCSFKRLLFQFVAVALMMCQMSLVHADAYDNAYKMYMEKKALEGDCQTIVSFYIVSEGDCYLTLRQQEGVYRTMKKSDNHSGQTQLSAFQNGSWSVTARGGVQFYAGDYDDRYGPDEQPVELKKGSTPVVYDDGKTMWNYQVNVSAPDRTVSGTEWTNKDDKITIYLPDPGIYSITLIPICPTINRILQWFKKAVWVVKNIINGTCSTEGPVTPKPPTLPPPTLPPYPLKSTPLTVIPGRYPLVSKAGPGDEFESRKDIRNYSKSGMKNGIIFQKENIQSINAVFQTGNYVYAEVVCKDGIRSGFFRKDVFDPSTDWGKVPKQSFDYTESATMIISTVPSSSPYNPEHDPYNKERENISNYEKHPVKKDQKVDICMESGDRYLIRFYDENGYKWTYLWVPKENVRKDSVFNNTSQYPRPGTGDGPAM